MNYHWLRVQEGKVQDAGPTSHIYEKLYLRYCCQAQIEKSSIFRINIDGFEYRVDFDKMEQTNLITNKIETLVREAKVFKTLGISLVVCRNKNGKWLSVNESGGRGWWLPGGRVDPPEEFVAAAVRETIEEAGKYINF